MTALDRNYYNNVSVTAAVSLKHTRIGYINYVQSVSASSAQTGFPASTLLNPLTYEFWKPATVPATLDIDLGQSRTCDYLGLGAHELGGCEITLYYSLTGATYVPVSVATLQDNTDAMILFTPVAARYWRIAIRGYGVESTFSADFENGIYGAVDDLTDSGDASIAVVYIGQALAMQRMIYGGHTPGVMSPETVYSDSESEGGQFLGRSVVRQSLTENYSFNNLSPAWVRDSFMPFAESAVTQPFFALWRPNSYANECVFGVSTQDIKPSNSGTRDFMSVSFSMRAYRGA